MMIVMMFFLPAPFFALSVCGALEGGGVRGPRELYLTVKDFMVVPMTKVSEGLPKLRSCARVQNELKKTKNKRNATRVFFPTHTQKKRVWCAYEVVSSRKKRRC